MGIGSLGKYIKSATAKSHIEYVTFDKIRKTADLDFAIYHQTQY